MGRGFGIETAIPDDIVKVVAAEAEARGYSSFWVNNPPGSDGLSSLAAAASVTQRIKLGVGVIPLDRHPASKIAENAIRLSLPINRLLLGVGSGGDQKGLDRVRNGVNELHTATGATVIISALGPKMTELAGEIADGVLFNWFTPEFEQLSSQRMAEAAARAERPRPLTMAYVRCALMPQAQPKLEERASRYAKIPQYARHFARMGVNSIETCVRGADATSLQAGIAEHERILDETIVRSITADDSAASILELLHACAPAR